MTENDTSTPSPLWFLRRYLRHLLFDKGTGWLQWGIDQRESYSWNEPPEPYAVAPPLRRIWATIQDRRYGYPEKGGKTAWRYLKDEDRKGDLMNFAPWRRYGFWVRWLP
jgi:hypothetical protein